MCMTWRERQMHGHGFPLSKRDSSCIELLKLPEARGKGAEFKDRSNCIAQCKEGAGERSRSLANSQKPWGD